MIDVNGKNAFPCLSCRQSLRYVAKVQVTTYNVETFRTRSDGRADNGELLTKVFFCSECGNPMRARYRLELLEILPAEVPQGQLPPELRFGKKGLLSAQHVGLVRALEKNGMLAAFSEAVAAQHFVSNRAPKDLPSALISFLLGAKQAVLPSVIVEQFGRDYHGPIEFWKYDGVGMVLCHGEVRRFVPIRAMNTNSAPALRVEGQRIDRGPEDYRWLRQTRKGMVPPEAKIFLASLRQSLGHCGREMNHVPLRK